MKDCIDPVFGFPTLVRFSWSTASKMLESKGLSVKWYSTFSYLCVSVTVVCAYDYNMSLYCNDTCCFLFAKA